MNQNQKTDDSWVEKNVTDYIILNKELGRGQYATVYQAYLKQNKFPVAAKVIRKDILLQQYKNDKQKIDYQLKLIIRQIEVQSQLKHPYIVDFYGFQETTNNVYFFLEYCDGGDLDQYLKQTEFLTETQCLDFFKQIVDALLMLAKKNIVHRDLKPANILLKNGQLKIADFGFAKEIKQGLDSQSVMNTLVGSPIFMCPQALEGNPNYDLKKGDVWSAGVCLYYMLYQEYPYYAEDIGTLIRSVNQQKLKFPSHKFKRSRAVQDLIMNMLEKDESKRFTWEQVAAHKCLNQQNLDNPLKNSIEINQISTISSFNTNLKDIEIRKQKENNLYLNGQQQEIYVNDPQIALNFKNLHGIYQIFTTIALIYRQIWKGLYSYQVEKQSIFKKINNLNRTAILMIVSLIEKEKNLLYNLSYNPKELISQKINQQDKQNQIKDIYLKKYFQSEQFLVYQKNIENRYLKETKVEYDNCFESLTFNLKELGFSQKIDQKNQDEYIQISFKIIALEYMETLLSYAIGENDKCLLLLLKYITLLCNKEEFFTENLAHQNYNKFAQKLEQFNFQESIQQAEEIMQIIQQLKKQEEEEECDD